MNHVDEERIYYKETVITSCVRDAWGIRELGKGTG